MIPSQPSQAPGIANQYSLGHALTIFVLKTGVGNCFINLPLFGKSPLMGERKRTGAHPRRHSVTVSGLHKTKKSRLRETFLSKSRNSIGWRCVEKLLIFVHNYFRSTHHDQFQNIDNNIFFDNKIHETFGSLSQLWSSLSASQLSCARAG